MGLGAQPCGIGTGQGFLDCSSLANFFLANEERVADEVLRDVNAFDLRIAHCQLLFSLCQPVVAVQSAAADVQLSVSQCAPSSGPRGTT